MTTVETRVVDPVPSHSSVDVSQPDLVNVALTQDEEEKILEDEDIESCEGEDLEEQMLNVALMNSVVESGGQPVKAEENSPGARYGLRKRPRPSESLESGSADAIDPKPVAVAMPRATIRNGRLSLVLPNSMGEVHTLTRGSEMEMPKLKQESSGEILTGETRIDEGRRSPIQQSIAPKIQIKTEPQSPRSLMQAVEPHGGFSAPKIPNKVKKVVSPKQSIARHTAAIPFQGASMNSVINTSGAVPNPLSQSTPPTTVRPVKAKIKVESSSTHPSVPCPLPSSVPCPLQPQPPEEQVERRVTIVEPPVPITRNRIFSVDLDPSTFDFPDISGDHNDLDKSDDDIVDITGDAPSDDLAIFKRDRAFSFEFFTFAGDDLLPAPPSASAQSSSLPEPSEDDDFITTRPRGDSIIFDPVSFQDGGIHEKNAIIKVNAAKEIDATPPTLFADSRLAAPPVPVGSQPPRITAVHVPSMAVPPTSHQSCLPMSPSSTESGQLVTLPSALSVPDANGNTSGTFQMELLNKDGRIGIYLPEARRARIARFHAKRKMRIWRKRIKYDCRKKLADSRPRIKGRFVKRSDMDE